LEKSNRTGCAHLLLIIFWNHFFWKKRDREKIEGKKREKKAKKNEKREKNKIDTFRNKFCQTISKSSFFVKFCARFCENRMYHFAFHFEQVFQCFFGDFHFQKWKILTFFFENRYVFLRFF